MTRRAALAVLLAFGMLLAVTGIAWAATLTLSMQVGDTATASCAGKSMSVSRLGPKQVSLHCRTSVTPTPTTTSPSATATSPSATGTPTGGNNCVASPHVCGYPDATNTGASGLFIAVPGQQTSGPGWHWDPRGWVEVDGAGATFSGFSTTATVDVTGANVTVSNDRLIVSSPTAEDAWCVASRHVHTTVDHVTCDGLIKDIYMDAGLTVTASNIYDMTTGIQTDSGFLADNYIHDLTNPPGAHVNGTTSNDGSAGLTIQHNTILNKWNQTDAISLFEDFGTQRNRLIDNNLVAGGGYCIYGGANAGGTQTSNIRITNNRISHVYFPNGGFWGWLAATDNGPGNLVSGNVSDETGLPIS